MSSDTPDTPAQERAPLSPLDMNDNLTASQISMSMSKTQTPGQDQPEMTWEDTKSIMGELETLFKSDEELKQINQLRDAEARLRSLSAAHMTDAKELVKKLGARVAALEDQLVPPLSQDEKAREIGELKMRQADATRQLEEMTNEINLNSEAISELKSREGQMQKEGGAVQSHHELEIPRVSYSISLYANITGIKWDYNREEGTLAGVVGDEGSQTLRAFDLSKDEGMTRYEMAEKLWDMLED
eukprot:CAMPEP_0119508638 /NCGR_PEP_ID=MMETSP1344-20130328/28182_1 /TAXON_ID=236787 /ORGANISM="Florenciella parvula, Strain CCMP2471" /LENGTH=242 /DNA_ID=CAMNT_0007545393 /DNA_START=1 /DNA_END=729 /DNA_ORIENTATION=+